MIVTLNDAPCARYNTYKTTGHYVKLGKDKIHLHSRLVWSL